MAPGSALTSLRTSRLCEEPGDAVKAADSNRSNIQSLKGERDRFIPVPLVLQNAKGNNSPRREVSVALKILSGV